MLEVPCPISCAVWVVVFPIALCLSHITCGKLVYAGSFYWDCCVSSAGPGYDDYQWEIHSEGDPETMCCRCCDMPIQECLKAPCSACVVYVRTVKPPEREIMIDFNEGPPAFSLTLVYNRAVQAKEREKEDVQQRGEGELFWEQRIHHRDVVLYDRTDVDCKELEKRIDENSTRAVFLRYVQNRSPSITSQLVHALNTKHIESISLMYTLMTKADVSRFAAALATSHIRELVLDRCFDKLPNTECADWALSEISSVGLSANTSVERLSLAFELIENHAEITQVLEMKSSKIKFLHLSIRVPPSFEAGEQNDMKWGEALRVNHALEMLLLRSCYFERIQFACQGLAMNDTLRELDLSNNSLREKQGEDLGAMLRANRALKCLSLEGSETDRKKRLGERGCEAIFLALTENHSLEILNICRQKAGARGGAAAAKMLLVNRALKSLNIDQNNIPPFAMQKIVDALKSNTSLETCLLGSYGNEMNGRVSAAAIADLISNNHTLMTLALERAMDPNGCLAVAQSLLSNRTLTSLDISDNGVSVTDAVAFISLLAGCAAKPVSGACAKCKQPSTAHPITGAMYLLHFKEEFLPTHGLEKYERKAGERVRVIGRQIIQRNRAWYVNEITSVVRGKLSTHIADLMFEYLTEPIDPWPSQKGVDRHDSINSRGSV